MYSEEKVINALNERMNELESHVRRLHKRIDSNHEVVIGCVAGTLIARFNKSIASVFIDILVLVNKC